MLQIRVVYPWSRRIFSIPDPGSEIISILDPGSEFFPSRIRIFSNSDPGSGSNNLSILTQKVGF